MMLCAVGILFLLAAAQARSFEDGRSFKRQFGYLPADFDLRLSHGHTGRLEIAYNGAFHSVCDADFDDIDATVACKQLGYLYGRKESRLQFGYGERRTLLDHLACSGAESRIIDCIHAGLGIYYCDGSVDGATITCANSPFYPLPQPQPRPPVGQPGFGGAPLASLDIQSIRLSNGPHAWEGLVEVQVDGAWKYVCTNNWDDMDAKVACRMMTSDRGAARPSQYYNTNLNFFQIQNMWMDDFQCRGTENALDQCPNMGYDRFSSNCVDKNMIAAAKCDAGTLAPAAETSIILEGVTASPYDGVVKCLHGDQYYPLCADTFGPEEAQVVCNQLFGYRGMVGTPVLPLGVQSNAYYMQGFYDVQCQGYETSMTQCFSNFISNRQRVCVTGDATVVCS